MWIETVDNEIVNTDCLSLIYISERESHCIVRAMGDMIDVDIYQCDTKEEAEIKLKSLLQQLNNEKINRWVNYNYLYTQPYFYPDSPIDQPYRPTCDFKDTIDITPHTTPYTTAPTFSNQSKKNV
jgi:hypothetical protein